MLLKKEEVKEKGKRGGGKSAVVGVVVGC